MVAAGAKPGDVFALTGGLGAGKTAFARGFIRFFGYQGRVNSPTFAIVNEYETDLANICHFDMYRITNGEALYDIGWTDYLDGQRILLIEWSENVSGALPPHYLTISIQPMDTDTKRRICIC